MDKNIGELIAEYLLESDENKPLHPELKEWLTESSSNRSVFDEYKKIWMEVSSYTPPVEFDSGKAWDKINSINQKNKQRRRKLINIGYMSLGIAASILLFVVLFSMEYFVRPTSLIEVNAGTNNGNRSEITLPDGTNVKLNTGTTINYSYNRQKNVREVNFHGEAFFEVAKNSSPFIIHTPDGLKIKVLGTTFTVSAYSEDTSYIISLIEGRIELDNQTQKLTLAPGEIIQYHRETRSMEKLNKNISHMYGWVDNKLYMDNMSLADVCKTLERWYNVKITLAPGLGESAHYNGVLQEDNVTDVLNALCSLSKIKYEINGRYISITSK